MRLAPHPDSFTEESEDEFVEWASSLDAPRAIDLFCGAGGLSLGLHEAGYEVVLGVDHDHEALETHRANFPGLSVNWDLGDPDVVERVIRLARSTGVDLVAGGPPCQPFSKAGRSMIRDLVRSGRREALDTRRDLWESFISVVDGVRPSAVLMENVPDMALDRDMQIVRTMVDILESLDYAVKVRVVETSRFEVPQFRQRLILVALANRTSFEWPNESGYQVTLRTAIGDLPPVVGGWRPEGGADGWADYSGPSTEFQRRARRDVPSSESTKLYDHITRPVRDDDLRIFAAMDSDTAYSEIDDAVAKLARVLESDGEAEPSTLKRYRDDIFDDKYKRLDWNQLSRTITAHIAKDGYWYIHPEQERTLTIREAARIQTFPDSFRFCGPPSAAFRQIGNAVPPKLGQLLGAAVLASTEVNRKERVSTTTIARTLAAWFEVRQADGDLRFPWLSPPSDDSEGRIRNTRWQVIQSELLFARARPDVVQALWPILQQLAAPSESAGGAGRVREIASWVDRSTHAERVIEAAQYFQANPELLDSVDGMRSCPPVTESIAELACRVAPGPEEDPVLATKGILRVAARFSGTAVDRRNSRSDGRLELARLIGAEDATSDHAFLALVELAEVLCTPTGPSCVKCPLAATCQYPARRSIGGQKPKRSATSG